MSVSRYPIWALVSEARRRAGLTQAELARRVGTSQAAIARYERARVMPSVATLYRIVGACGLDLRMQLVDADPPPSPGLQAGSTEERLERLENALELIGSLRNG